MSGYNGWSNWETWLVNVWAGEYIFRTIQNILVDNPEETLYNLSEAIKEDILSANPLISETSMYSDLLGSALSQVNWMELTETMLADVKEEMPTISK